MYRRRFPPNRYEICVLRNSICLCDSLKLCEQETESGERPILCFLQRFLVDESAAPWQKNKQTKPAWAVSLRFAIMWWDMKKFLYCKIILRHHALNTVEELILFLIAPKDLKTHQLLFESENTPYILYVGVYWHWIGWHVFGGRSLKEGAWYNSVFKFIRSLQNGWNGLLPPKTCTPRLVLLITYSFNKPLWKPLLSLTERGIDLHRGKETPCNEIKS